MDADPAHDPFGLDNVQVGDPLIGDDDAVERHQQLHPEADIDEGEDAFRFDGSAFDDNDYMEEEGTTNEVGETNAGNGDEQRTTIEAEGGSSLGPENVVHHMPRTPPTPRIATPTADENFAGIGNILVRPMDPIEETPPHGFNESDQLTDPWKTESLLVWHGLFVFNKQSFFNCTCTAVSGGRAVFKAGREMMPLPMAPASTSGAANGDGGRIHLTGLSDSRGVWEYVSELKESLNKMVCLLVINMPEAKHDFDHYMVCYTFFYNQGTQVGVLDFAEHPTIKEGYLFTLSPGEPLPSALLPLDGIGLPGWTQHNGCIILMLVRRMDHEDKQWKRHRLGMGVGDESWRRQQEMLPHGNESDDHMTDSLKIESLLPCFVPEHIRHLMDNPLSSDDINFAENVEPTHVSAMDGDVGPIPFGGQMRMFDAFGNTSHQVHHPLQSRPMFSEISPIGPSTSSSFRQQHLQLEEHQRNFPYQRSAEPFVNAGIGNFETPVATTSHFRQTTFSSAMMPHCQHQQHLQFEEHRNFSYQRISPPNPLAPNENAAVSSSVSQEKEPSLFASVPSDSATVAAAVDSKEIQLLRIQSFSGLVKSFYRLSINEDERLAILRWFSELFDIPCNVPSSLSAEEYVDMLKSLRKEAIEKSSPTQIQKYIEMIPNLYARFSKRGGRGGGRGGQRR